MLRIDELIAAIVMSQAVGDRPYGHFDHDANCVEGPDSAVPMTPVPSVLSPMSETVVLADGMEAREDPATGEILYFPRG